MTGIHFITVKKHFQTDLSNDLMSSLTEYLMSISVSHRDAELSTTMSTGCCKESSCMNVYRLL